MPSPALTWSRSRSSSKPRRSAASGTASASLRRVNVVKAAVVWAFSILDNMALDTPLRPESWFIVQSRFSRYSRTRSAMVKRRTVSAPWSTFPAVSGGGWCDIRGPPWAVRARSLARIYTRPVSRSVSPVSTSVAVAGYIRDWIHAGNYGAGDRLPPQRELAELLGVSRVSVREGLKPLVEAGYLEMRRGASGGAFVTELTQPIEAWRRKLRNQMGELDDVVEFRVAVESRVAYLAALRSTRTELAEMRSAIRATRAINGDGKIGR